MSKKESIFNALTPTDNAKLGIYKEALDFALDKKNKIKNIALAGPLGSGKSSVLETYKKEIKEDKRRLYKPKFIHISLTDFKSDSSDKENKIDFKASSESGGNNVEYTSVANDNHSESIEKLEGKILNQLIHKIDPDNIPLTDFKLKKEGYQDKIILFVFSLFFVILSIIVLALNKYNLLHSGYAFISHCIYYLFSFLPDVTIIAEAKTWILTSLFFQFAHESVVKVFLSVSSFIITGIWTYIFLKKQYERKLIKRISFQGAEIEVFDKDEVSFFNKYLNEVIYLFQKSGADVIVFEDLDRFKQNKIFEKLRELNFIINNNHIKANIKFMYLLSDDSFTSTNRTKFFDFIIPIIPVVDSSNSYDQFYSLLNKYLKGKSQEESSISYKLLYTISLYVDEMRLIYNIYNEFIIYKNKLETELDNDTEIKHKDHKKDESKKEKFKISYDYDKILALITYKNIFPEDFLNLPSKTGLVYSLFHLKDEYNKKYNVHKTLSELLSTPERTPDKNKTVDNLIKSAFPEITISISEEILRKVNVELIITLLINGFIDEQYPDYITYFYSTSLTPQDKIYLKSFYENMSYGFNYKLDRVDQITIRLEYDQHNFSSPQILNFDLLFYLCRNSHKDIAKIVEYIISKKEYSFILKFNEYLVQKINRIISEVDTVKYSDIAPDMRFAYKNGEIQAIENTISTFVNMLNSRLGSICNSLISNEELEYALRKNYSLSTLAYSHKQTFAIITHANTCLKDFILQDSAFFEISSEAPLGLYLMSIAKGVKTLDAKTEKIDTKKIDRAIFNALYQNNLYEINKDTLVPILHVQYTGLTDEDIYYKNYASILKDIKQPLIEYIHDSKNIDAYASVMLDISEKKILDTEEVAVQLLKNIDITLDNKKRYISYLKITLTNINEVDTDLWNNLLDNKIISYNKNNILSYYNAKCTKNTPLNDQLVAFINSCDTNLEFTIPNEEDKQHIKTFLDDIVRTNNITNERYSTILSKHLIDGFNTTELDNEKISFLISKNLIAFSAPKLDFIMTNYSSFKVKYILNNIDKYIELPQNQRPATEIVELLKQKLSIDIQKKLINISPNTISIREQEFSNSLEMRIVEVKFDINDLTYIAAKYKIVGVSSTYNKLILDKILEHFSAFEGLLRNNELSLSEKLFFDLLLSEKSTLDLDKRKTTINLIEERDAFPEFTQPHIQRKLAELTKKDV